MRLSYNDCWHNSCYIRSRKTIRDVVWFYVLSYYGNSNDAYRVRPTFTKGLIMSHFVYYDYKIERRLDDGSWHELPDTKFSFADDAFNKAKELGPDYRAVYNRQCYFHGEYYRPNRKIIPKSALKDISSYIEYLIKKHGDGFECVIENEVIRKIKHEIEERDKKC